MKWPRLEGLILAPNAWRLRIVDQTELTDSLERYLLRAGAEAATPVISHLLDGGDINEAKSGVAVRLARD